MESSLNTLWLIFASFLVLLMQAGFLMLEGGRVRSKNSINVAQKNITDMVVVWLVFFGVGFYIMFGTSALVFIEGNTGTNEAYQPMYFVFQFAFCCTTATILSGAVSERLSFRAYLLMVAFIGAFTYPLVGRLVWGDAYNSNVTAVLSDMGFIDFAGSTVVHGVGAWFSLVVLLMIGPRIGRFDKDGVPQPMSAHSSVMALYGVLILMLGWIGFNGGALSPSDPRLQSVIFHTLSSAVSGAACGMSIGLFLDKGVFNPARVTTGLLGGLVACTAGVHLMSGYDSILVGMLGGTAATYGAHWLLYQCKLDDPLEAIATHGIAGVAGTLAVALYSPEASLVSGGRLAQFGIQLIGVVAVFAICVVSCYLLILVMKRFMQIRVSAESERIGLNYTEHGEAIGTQRLQNALEERAKNRGIVAGELLVDADDEHSELAASLNQLIGQYEAASKDIVSAQQRFQQFAETASDWLWETNEFLSFIYLKANSEQMSDTGLGAIVGRNLFDVLEMDATQSSALTAVVSRQEATQVFEAEISLEDKHATKFSVEVRGVPVFDTEHKFLGYRGTITDISTRKAAENRAVYLSLHDELTGLPNRRALSEDIQMFVQNADSRAQAVVVAGVDLDGFKGVNDAYGHLVGDALLKQVADRLERFLRPNDRAYRTGGDEFIVVLTELDTARADVVAKAIMQRLIEELSELYFVQTIDLKVGASIGLAEYPMHSKDSEDLLRLADLALYEAKARGKGCVVRFDDDLDIDAKLQLKIEADLHKAIAEKEFYLVYQPQVDTISGKTIGFEALIRWAHPERGEIPPADFISVAEKLNLMDKIGTFVLDAACEFAAGWQPDPNGDTLKIAVNVSPQQFRNESFCRTVRETLKRHQLPPERLELEITEDVLVFDFQEVSSMLDELRSMNVLVAIDDFGSGQTSLRYLNKFPISSIKIDRSFVKHLASDEKAAEITQTIVALGHRLGVTVLAEGVEEANQLSLLQNWNCDQIQGFLFSEPMSAESALDAINTGRLPQATATKDRAA